MVENAVVGMSATLAEETAVKDPEDDEAFRAKDKQMGVEWFDGLRTRQRKRRGLVLSRKLKPRLWQTTDVNRACYTSTSSQREPSSPVLAWYILVWTQPSSVAFTECWDTLLFHLDLVAGQPRRTSLAPLLCPRHINFYVGVTASQKFMWMLFFRQPLFTVFEAHKLLCF